jgi:hypothetical protein
MIQPNVMRLLRVGVVLVLLAVAAGVGGIFVKGRLATRQTQQGSYYCPMHPTYTSNRPGDCPICNMRLVPREATEGQGVPAGPQESKPTDLKTICYLHNCPKVHAGQPCPMTVVAKPGEAVTCPICGTHVAEAAPAKAERKILYWTDPMIPGYRADGPGKSPMGMDLVPVYAEDAGPSASASPVGYAPVLVSPERRQLIGVTTQPAARRDLTKTIRTVGRIAYDPELYQAQQEYLEALRAVRRAEPQAAAELTVQARQLVDAARLRLRLLGLSDALIDELDTQEAPDQSLLLADPDRRAWVYATVYEYELPLVMPGQTVRVEAPSLPGRTFEGTIRAIDPVLDPQTRSARLRAVLTDTEGVLKPEMFVNASVTVPLGEVLAVPEEAVFNTGSRQIVFVDKGEGLFEPRDVTVGAQVDGLVEITEGVIEGEVVVTSGNFLIDSESRLKAALAGAATPGHQHGQ